MPGKDHRNSMRTEDLLEQCLQALISGQELPPEIARYLARHPEQRAEVEDVLFVAQRISHVPSAELAPEGRLGMQARLAEKLGFEPSVLDAQPEVSGLTMTDEAAEAGRQRKRSKPLLSLGPITIARLRYEPLSTPQRDPASAARIREVFRDLTPDEIRRYIGVRGEDYLYYRQRLPGWEPVFSCLAFILRGFKRLEKLAGLI